MKILLCHNQYQQQGGEDQVFLAEKKLLESYPENTVNLFIVNNDKIKNLFSKISVTLSLSYSIKQKKKLSQILKNNRPDVVHVHNFFPLLSPSIYDACMELNIPVVQTLHNYRIICPSALLMKNNLICEKCINGTPYNAALYRCYRDSIIGSLVVARMVNKHRKQETWNNKVTRFIALTDFAKGKFVEAGISENKIIIKPNFIDERLMNKEFNNNERKGALFVGRLSNEKGILTLLKAWQQIDLKINIAGDGPLFKQLINKATNNINFLGNIDKTSVLKEMERAEFLIMPSECYEGFPMVLVEAFSQGLPVIASRLGGMKEIVEDRITGLLFDPTNTNDLAAKVNWLKKHPKFCKKMGLNARKIYEEQYTAKKNYKMLTAIYQECIDSVKVKSN